MFSIEMKYYLILCRYNDHSKLRLTNKILNLNSLLGHAVNDIKNWDVDSCFVYN